MRIRKGLLVPRDDGKRIEEFVGNAHTQTSSMSVAHMWAPPGWREPPQVPEFDEAVVVLSGALTLVVDGRRETIRAGEVGLVRAGRKVVYRNDGRGPCDYWSICSPGFLPQLAHMAPPLPEPRRRNALLLDISHRRGARLEGLLRTQGHRYLELLKLRGVALSVSLVTDAAIRGLNRQFRKKDRATDVLSFPAGEMPVVRGQPRQLGDVVISLDTAERVARGLGRAVETELCRYLAHGVLHLLGHDHVRPAEARRMRALENRLLGEDGLLPEGVHGE
jgi:probable rRNA maturation factor